MEQQPPVSARSQTSVGTGVLEKNILPRPIADWLRSLVHVFGEDVTLFTSLCVLLSYATYETGFARTLLEVSSEVIRLLSMGGSLLVLIALLIATLLVLGFSVGMVSALVYALIRRAPHGIMRRLMVFSAAVVTVYYSGYAFLVMLETPSLLQGMGLLTLAMGFFSLYIAMTLVSVSLAPERFLHEEWGLKLWTGRAVSLPGAVLIALVTAVFWWWGATHGWAEYTVFQVALVGVVAATSVARYLAPSRH